MSQKQNSNIDSKPPKTYSIYAIFGDKTHHVHASIRIDRLMKHSKLGARAISNLKEHNTTFIQTNRAITLPVDASSTTEVGLCYVLNSINLTPPHRNLILRPVADLVFNMEIYSAVRELELVQNQWTFRHHLLTRISNAVPTGELLSMAYLLHKSDVGAYNRTITRTAEWIVSGGGVVKAAAEKLLKEIEHIPALRSDLERCCVALSSKKNVKMVTAFGQTGSKVDEACREKLDWELKQGLREANEYEVGNMGRWDWK